MQVLDLVELYEKGVEEIAILQRLEGGRERVTH